MRVRLQEILDKDWPDSNMSGRFPNYGAYDKYRALIHLAMDAQDCGDMVMYDIAIDHASSISEPDLKRANRQGKAVISVTIPQYHKLIHNTDPKLLIFREKHGDWHFITNNATEFSMALLTVLDLRQKHGYFMDELYGDDVPKVEDGDPDQTDMFTQTKERPKTDKEKVQAIIDLARSGEPGCVIKAGKRAHEFIKTHEDHEYEGFEIVYPGKADFDLTPA